MVATSVTPMSAAFGTDPSRPPTSTSLTSTGGSVSCPHRCDCRWKKRRRRNGGIFRSTSSCSTDWLWLQLLLLLSLGVVTRARVPPHSTASTNRQSHSPLAAPHHEASHNQNHHSHAPTIVSGYGSSRHPYAGSVRVITTTTTTTVSTPSSLYEQVQQQRDRERQQTSTIVQAIEDEVDSGSSSNNHPFHSHALYIQAVSDPSFGSSSSASLMVHSVEQNATLCLSSSDDGTATNRDVPSSSFVHIEPVRDDNDDDGIASTRRNVTVGWIPVQGLWGVYHIPSGYLSVWIVSSDPVYTATTTRRRRPDTVTDEEEQQSNDASSSFWWQIRRVRELHIVRVVVDDQKLMTRAQRHEEQRQVSLLRQALKDHDWYFCQRPSAPTSRSNDDDDDDNVDNCTCDSDNKVLSRVLLPDMTRSLQTSVLSRQLQKRGSSSIQETPAATLPSPIGRPSDSIAEHEQHQDADLGRDGSSACRDDNTRLSFDDFTHGHESSHNGSPWRQWWEPAAATSKGDDNDTHLSSMCDAAPDSRFFWNHNQVEPLVQLLASAEQRLEQQESNHNYAKQSAMAAATAAACRALLEHVIPVTSAFCGVQTNLGLMSNEDDYSEEEEDSSSPLRYDQVLISRRSRFRAGTRFAKRGADATGAVANFAETEQILLVWEKQASSESRAVEDDQLRTTHPTQPRRDLLPWKLGAIMSHVQTRGSIPLRWSSPTDIKTYRPRIRIGTDPLAQARAVRAHLVDQTVRYLGFPAEYAAATIKHDAASTYVDARMNNQTSGKAMNLSGASLLLVNLVDKKSDQGRLGRALDSVLMAVLDVYSKSSDSSAPWLKSLFVQHLWYDFHAEVKSGRWDKLVGLLKQVQPALDSHGYFWATPADAVNDEAALSFDVRSIQSGVVRTNCMDCLDRTNVAQSIFGRYMLFEQLANYNSSQIAKETKMQFQKSPMTLPWLQGEVAHRLLWADNADLISRLYAGTPALKGDFTRTGKRTKQGALNDGLNSVQRYYLNNFLDADRQEGVSLLTGDEPFSHVDGEPIDDNLKTDGPQLNGSRKGMTVQEAARRLLLGASPAAAVEGDSSDRYHVRIKVKKSAMLRRSSGSEHRLDSSLYSSPSLDLRWLPGDLQTQVRGVISSYPNPNNHTGFQSREYLDSMEIRSASDTPWWVMAESSSDGDSDSTELDASVGTAAKTISESLDPSGSNPGLLLGALVFGSRAPLTMAVMIVAVVSASFTSSSSNS